jgi:uncharacterized protein YcaQ
MTLTSISVRAARRLALARSGFLKPGWTEMPTSAGRGAAAARRAAHRIIDRFGYLQLDTVSVAGARSHAIVLLSRLDGFPAELGEALLQPGEPLFEYWGHEVCWLPMSMYPDMGWRRERFRHHPWWGDVIGKNPELARDIMARVRNDGPLKSSDLEGPSGKGWWNHKPAKNVAVALWTAGDLVVRERKGFQRTFDLPERVIPAAIRETPEPTLREALPRLLLRAIDGHGWAQTGTLAQSWRLRNLKAEIQAALEALSRSGSIVPCMVGKSPGWIRPGDLELAERLLKARPTESEPRLLSPFDPLLWDRTRIDRLFGFKLAIEIFKPAEQRQFGYYCLPVLAGERLIGRVDLKADRKAGRLRVKSWHPEADTPGLPDAVRGSGPPSKAVARELAAKAVARYAAALDLDPAWR